MLVDKNGTEVHAGDILQLEGMRYHVMGIGEEPLSQEAIDFCKKCEIVEESK